MLLEYLDTSWAPNVNDEADVVRAARTVVETIAKLPQGLPCYLDIGSEQRWAEEVDHTLIGLSGLIADGRFARCGPDDLAFLARWSSRADLIEAIEGSPRLVNGDIKFGQVFDKNGHLCLVDWQVPVVGPADLDFVMLLEDQGVDPRPHASAAVVELRWYLLLRWAVHSKLELIPSMPTLFENWTLDALERMRTTDTS